MFDETNETNFILTALQGDTCRKKTSAEERGVFIIEQRTIIEKNIR